MTQNLIIGTAGGNKVINTITIGTVGGNKTVTAGWIGTASGNQQFYSSTSGIVTVFPLGVSAAGVVGTVTAVVNGGTVSVSATGVSASGSIGSVVVITGGGVVVTTTGVSASGSVGNVAVIDQPLSAVASPESQSWSGSVGSWLATVSVEITGGTGTPFPTITWYADPAYLTVSNYGAFAEISSSASYPPDATVVCKVFDDVTTVYSNTVSISGY